MDQLDKLTTQIIKAGTILYRADEETVLKEELKTGKFLARKCSDTKKTGKYFGNRPLFATAISVERKKKLSIGYFKVIEDIICYDDKYSFKFINPGRFKDKRTNYINNQEIIDNENINHFDQDTFPIIDKQFDRIVVEGKCPKGAAEIFIVPEDLCKIKLEYVYDLPDHDIVLQNIIKTNYSFDSEWYLNYTC